MTRIYGFTWILAVAAASLLLISGYWSSRSFLVMGTSFIVLIFIGIKGVLPSTLGDHAAPTTRKNTDE
jgi:hypothetical protein